MDSTTNYRTPLLMEPALSSSNIMRTPLGNVITQPPPLPALPSNMNGSINGATNLGSYSSGFGSYGNPYASYGSSFGGYGMNPFNSGFGNGMFGSGMGMYNGGGFGGYNNRFGGGSGSCLSPYDPETRFIQLAEENSRPAFESIGSLVSAVANIASMLDSTFYAITSSFHAILGVAANFGRLRGVFSQFWQTFAIFRGLTWVYRKLLYWMKISNVDPSSRVFKEAFEAAKSEAFGNSSNPQNFDSSKKQSPWPVVLFLSFIFTAPYVVMKLLGNLKSSVIQETKDPRRWIKPIKSVALYDFQARTPSELTIKAGQTIYIAPKEIQNTQKLLNSGWAIATVDAVHSGLIPITYCKKETSVTHPQNVTPPFTTLSPVEKTKVQPEISSDILTNSAGLQETPSNFIKDFNAKNFCEADLNEKPEQLLNLSTNNKNNGNNRINELET